MISLISISLENEMDLILAHKRSMKVAEKIGLTVATQTTFATAVSEIARSVIEHSDSGILELGIEQQKQRYSLKALIQFDSGIRFTNEDEGFYYAQKLVPTFEFTESPAGNAIEMKIGLPRSLKLDPVKIHGLKTYFQEQAPLNAYEQLKKRNLNLNKIAGEQEEELKRSKLIDDKKNEFIAMASHEIKTPLTVIKAYVQMLKISKDHSSEKVSGFAAKIEDQINKLVMLVQQLLDVSKIENGHLVYDFEELELNAYINDMVEVMKNIVPKHQLTTSLCESVQVRMDKLRMEQVFTNLLGNAAKYSQEDTSINIQCAIEDDEFVKISISDQGMGMSDHTMQSIFKKFYRDKDVLITHSGLGMGLYIASKIITDHGGTITVESKEGSGSTFIFRLPYTA